MAHINKLVSAGIKDHHTYFLSEPKTLLLLAIISVWSIYLCSFERLAEILYLYVDLMVCSTFRFVIIQTCLNLGLLWVPWDWQHWSFTQHHCCSQYMTTTLLKWVVYKRMYITLVLAISLFLWLNLTDIKVADALVLRYIKWCIYIPLHKF